MHSYIVFPSFKSEFNVCNLHSFRQTSKESAIKLLFPTQPTGFISHLICWARFFFWADTSTFFTQSNILCKRIRGRKKKLYFSLFTQCIFWRARLCSYLHFCVYCMLGCMCVCVLYAVSTHVLRSNELNSY